MLWDIKGIRCSCKYVFHIARKTEMKIVPQALLGTNIN